MSLSGLKRNSLDKFYTKLEIVDLCLNIFKNNVKVRKRDIIIEPSAGNGAFSNALKRIYKNNKYFYDIEPENEDIIEQDFLELDFSNLEYMNEVHIIGNPPFGRQSSLAKKFIKKSSEIAKTISFILPKSFKKESFQKTFPKQFHLIFETDLPSNSFEINNISHDVPCVFQIWRKEENERHIEEDIQPHYYEYVKKEENPDISFRRVGVNAGYIDIDVESKNIQSHYFIKFTEDIDIEVFFQKYRDDIVFEFENTVGPKSISKKELNRKLVNLYKNEN